jgi:hypothetical protein
MNPSLRLITSSLVRLPEFETITEMADYVNKHDIALIWPGHDGSFYTTTDQLPMDEQTRLQKAL